MIKTFQEFAEALRQPSRLERLRAVWSRAPAAMQVAGRHGRVVVALGCGLPAAGDAVGLQLEKEAAPEQPARALCEVWVDMAREGLPPELTAAVDTTLDGVLDRVVFWFKDASPDAILTAVLVLARLNGVPAAAIPSAWLDDVAAWDRGRMPLEPEQSWSAHASAWAHALFPEPTDDHEPTAQRFAQAWYRVLAFAAVCLATPVDPQRMPRSLPGEGPAARAALRRLRQVYDATVRAATVLQLTVPLRGASARWVAVDALCFEELEASDAVKVFGRSDRDGSPGKRGFALGISHRPKDKDWNRFTVHSDPDAQLDLTTLWVHLERLETAAWRDASGAISRPADAAVRTDARFRAGHATRSYDLGDIENMTVLRGEARPLVGVVNCWVNPWFLFPDGSLIGSPGKDKQRVDAGPTRLSWSQVVEAVWRCYSPLSSMVVQSHDAAGQAGGPCAPWQAAPIAVGDAVAPEKEVYLRHVRWVPGSGGSVHAPEVNDTLLQALATLAGCPAMTAMPEYATLVPRGTFEHVELNGGLAVITERGCLVIDDWRKPTLDAVALVDAMVRARRILIASRELAGRFKDLAAQVVTALRARSRLFGRAPYEVLRDLADQRFRIATTTAERDADLLAVLDSNAALLYRRLSERWLSADRLERTDAGLARLEQTVRGVLDARTAAIVKLGFPAAVAPAISAPLAAYVNAAFLGAGIRLDVSDAVAEELRKGGEIFSWAICAVLLYLIITRIFESNTAPPTQSPE